MTVLDLARSWLIAHQVPERRELSLDPDSPYPPLIDQVADVWRGRTAGSGPLWRAMTIKEALSVPSIQRCVTLISGAAASLTPQTYQDGAVMDKTSPVIARPNPYDTPQAFYRDSFWNLATRGENVMWVASYDSDGRPAALVVVPLHELTVQANERNRLRPIYRWGSEESTRYSPVTPEGRFVHVVYARDPGDLRGTGPLQMARSAVSVSVESQEWAANFYAEGGPAATELHHPEDMEDNEVEDARSQWLRRPGNTVRVTTGDWEVKDHEVNPQGAQMLEARVHNNGDAARMFGVPGALLEFSAPGSSLTYQNIAEVFTMFVRSSLAINYLEPMEQVLSDLLPRSTAARFNVEGFLRADAKTRWEIYKIASEVIGLDEAGLIAREREGLAPGDVEFEPVPFAPPSAVPSALPLAAGGVRCTGMRMLRGRLEPCGRKLTESGPFVGTCPRCKKSYQAA